MFPVPLAAGQEFPVPLAVQVQVGLPSSAGIGSVTPIPVTRLLPLFVTVTVNPTSAPGLTVSGVVSCLFTLTFTLPPAVIETVAVLFVELLSWNCGTLCCTRAVIVPASPPAAISLDTVPFTVNSPVSPDAAVPVRVQVRVLVPVQLQLEGVLMLTPDSELGISKTTWGARAPSGPLFRKVNVCATEPPGFTFVLEEGH